MIMLNERKLNPLIRNSEPSKAWPWNKLKPFCTEQLDSLKFLICKYPKVTFPSGGIGGRGDSWVLNY
uniref:Uncharacterized protein n=1 Tax=Vitis vinifera TaxID=29760 RepID=F6HD13_VITVI